MSSNNSSSSNLHYYTNGVPLEMPPHLTAPNSNNSIGPVEGFEDLSEGSMNDSSNTASGSFQQYNAGASYTFGGNYTTPTAVNKQPAPTPSYSKNATTGSNGPATRPISPVPVHSGINASTNFYVPANTLVQVSCGDDRWSYGYWRDNHRAVNVLDSSLRGNTSDFLFVRLADVALNDSEGHPMYLASNRQRPCYIAFPPGTVLYYNLSEVNGTESSGTNTLPTTSKNHNRRGGRGRNPVDTQHQGQRSASYSDVFEAIDLSALQFHLCPKPTRTSTEGMQSNVPSYNCSTVQQH